MEEVYYEYIVVNSNNYQLSNENSIFRINLCEIKCLPYKFNNEDNLGCDDSIENHIFTAILPRKMDKSKFIGARVVFRRNEFGQMEFCQDAGINYDFYDRCKNLASVIETFSRISSTTTDSQIIKHLSTVLNNLLADRMRKVFASRNNYALSLYGEKSIEKISNEIIALNNLVGLVDSVRQIESEFKVCKSEDERVM